MESFSVTGSPAVVLVVEKYQIETDASTVGQGKAQGRKEHCKVVPDIVHVLLGIYELVERRDAVMRKKLAYD